MKSIIKNKVYDTNTANCLGKWRNGDDAEDFRYMAEALYQTKKGSLFLHAEGGALTSLASHHGPSSGPGEAIYLLTKDQAVEWCTRTGNSEIAVEHFSDTLTEA
jgi:hypothetical protein